jgi:hypothetical protein
MAWSAEQFEKRLAEQAASAAPAPDPPAAPAEPPADREPTAEELAELNRRLSAMEKSRLNFEERHHMSDITLTAEERELISARRTEKARADAERAAADALPNVQDLTAEQYLKLSPEKRSAMMKANFEAATRRD